MGGLVLKPYCADKTSHKTTWHFHFGKQKIQVEVKSGVAAFKLTSS